MNDARRMTPGVVVLSRWLGSLERCGEQIQVLQRVGVGTQPFATFRNGFRKFYQDPAV
jgi:hypothetical protein